MTNDFFAGFLSGSTFILVCLAIFQLGVNKGVQISIRVIDDYPAARNVLIKTKKTASTLTFISRVEGE